MNSVRIPLILAVVMVCLLALSPSSYAKPPEAISIHGTLLDASGTALEGERAWIVRFTDAQTDGLQLGPDQYGQLTVSPEGLFNIEVTLPESAYTAEEVWYILAIDTDSPADDDATDDVFPEPFKLYSVPFARQAATVTHVDPALLGTGTVDDTELGALDGIAGGIQGQLDAKADKVSVYTRSTTDGLLDQKANAASVATSLSGIHTELALKANTAALAISEAAQDSVIAGKANADDVYLKLETELLLAEKADVDSVYTREDVDAALADKADAGTSYTKVESDAALADKADAGTSYTKPESDAALADKADIGTSYTKTESDAALLEKADLVNVYTREDAEATFALKTGSLDAYTKTETDEALALKMDKAESYTKSQVDTSLAAKANAATIYTRTETDTALASKADLTNIYTKAQADTLLAGKANVSTTYTKTQVDTALTAKADAATTYTKTEVDTALTAKADTTNVYDKATTDAFVTQLTQAQANFATAVNAKANTADVNASQAAQDTAINGKANASAVYTKTETEVFVGQLTNAHANLANVVSLKAYTSDVNASQATQDTAIAGKASNAEFVSAMAGVNSQLKLKANTADLEISEAAQDAVIAGKADASNVYDKASTDAVVGQISQALANLDTAVQAKANTTDVNNSQASQDTAIASKADKATTYTKTEVDSALTAKANAADVYTKTEVDAFNTTTGGTLTTQSAAIETKMPLSGTGHIVVRTTNDSSQNATNLQTTYTTAKAMTPNGVALSATNRAVVILQPGRYDLGTGQLLLDAEYVDLVGLSTARANQYIVGLSTAGVLRQTANNVHIENLTVECAIADGTIVWGDPNVPAAYYPNTGSTETFIRNCEFKGDADANHCLSMRGDVTYAGRYERVVAGIASFGVGASAVASGSFIECVGDYGSFGSGGVASGTFTDCIGAFGSFATNGTASGLFVRCKAGDYSFGGGDTGNTAIGGRFFYCVADGTSSFTTNGAPTLLYCVRNGAVYP